MLTLAQEGKKTTFSLLQVVNPVIPIVEGSVAG